MEFVSNWMLQLGGTVELLSAAAGGHGYRVRVPLARNQQSLRRSEVESAAAKSWLQGRAVLIVDDDAVSARVIRQFIEKRYGAKVTDARDGIEAMGIFASHRQVDLLIVDQFMPRLGGPELIERLRVSGNLVPVIGITAGSGGGSKTRLLLREHNQCCSSRSITPSVPLLLTSQSGE